MQFSEQLNRLKHSFQKFSIPEDRAVLITCIGAAFVFWFLVKLSQTYQTEKTVAFALDIPEGKALVTMPPDDLSVNVEAPGWDLMFDYFSGKQLVLPIDLQNTDQLSLNRGQLLGEIRRMLSSDDISIDQVNYDNLNFVLEDRIEKKVPIILHAALSFRPEYHLEEPISMVPDSVVISGSASLVDQIDHWTTDSLILSDLTTSATLLLPLTTPARELTLDQRTVEVQVPIEQFTEKSLYVPVRVINAPQDSIKIFPERVNLSAVVGLSRYNDLEYQDFELIADLKNVRLQAGKNTVPIALSRQPSFVQNVKLSRNAIEFYIVKD